MARWCPSRITIQCEKLVSRNSYDVIIVGAGPAGSTLAYELARKSVRTLIVERDVLPRYKT